MTETMSAEEFRELAKKPAKARTDPRDKRDLHDFLANLAGFLGADLAFETEVTFHPTRRWRFDYAWPQLKIAVEYDGVMLRTVGHNSLAGILRDSEKINEAQRLGWRVFRANAKSVRNESFLVLIYDVLEDAIKEL